MLRKSVNLRFFLKILDYQDSDALKKNNGFSRQNSSTHVLFSHVFLKEDILFVVAEEYTFEK